MLTAITLIVLCAVGLVRPQNMTTPVCTGTDKDTAALCPDENGEACKLFEPATTDATPTVDSRCVDPNYEPVASKCRKTCLSCCQDPNYMCDNKLGTVINCTAIAENNLCKTNDTSFQEMLAIECPQSCGLCASGSCVDEDPKLCSTLGLALCYHKDYYQIMEDKCKRTCLRCDQATTTGVITVTTTAAGGSTTTSSGGGAACADVANNCAANLNLCNDATYHALMVQKCAASCGFCSGTGTTTSSVICADASSVCSTWVSNGFCTSSYYTTAQKQQYCARSCGLC